MNLVVMISNDLDKQSLEVVYSR